MKLLVTGKGGKAGSWACRGDQLGAAIGATVKPMATRVDTEAADLTIVVKRTPEAVIQALRGRRWVFDVVDCYPQPEASAWTKHQAVAWVRNKIAELNPTAIIWPTKRMGEDCGIDKPSICLPHHHRPRIDRNPIRERVMAIGYEGAPPYIETWMPAIRKQCERRGWQFVLNPARLADLDIVLALRGGNYDGYVQRHWKSNVKLANAHGSGTPFIGQRECGYDEMSSGAEYWIEDAKALELCFDLLSLRESRQQIQEWFLPHAYPVEQAGSELLSFLHGL